MKLEWLHKLFLKMLFLNTEKKTPTNNLSRVISNWTACDENSLTLKLKEKKIQKGTGDLKKTENLEKTKIDNRIQVS